tara:strand:- start:2424 stop:2849 length:426 start_codon:yes stop_codon:yes gene_type:complete
MAVPFKGDFPFLKKHTEDEYLKLETNFKNLFIAVKSLAVIYENSDNKNSVKLGALSMSIERIINEYKEFEGSLTLQGASSSNSATTNQQDDSPQKFAFRVNEEELDMMVESLEHLACMLGVDDHDFPKYNTLAEEIKKLKR